METGNPITFSDLGEAPSWADPECLIDCPVREVCEERKHGFPIMELGKGDQLFHAGDPLKSLYLVLSGAVKIEAQLESGDLQIVDLAFRGDLLGGGAIENRRHRMTATAQTGTRLCVLPTADAEDQRVTLPLVRAMGNRMRQMQWFSARLRNQTAEQGVIRVLLRVHDAEGEAEGPLRLPVSRGEIANYLGIAVETVSRVMHRLQDEGLLRTSGRQVWLKDLDGLRARITVSLEA